MASWTIYFRAVDKSVETLETLEALEDGSNHIVASQAFPFQALPFSQPGKIA